jgi:hypothetical protein
MRLQFYIHIFMARVERYEKSMIQSKYKPFIAAAIMFVLMIIITIIIEKFWYSLSLRYILDIMITLFTIGTYFFVRYRAKNLSAHK